MSYRKKSVRYLFKPKKLVISFCKSVLRQVSTRHTPCLPFLRILFHVLITSSFFTSVNLPNLLSLFPSTVNAYVCPIQDAFLFCIIFMGFLFSFPLLNTSSFLILSVHFTFLILLHSPISKHFKYFCPFCLTVHVSPTQDRMLYTKHLSTLFWRLMGMVPVVTKCFTLPSAFFPRCILRLTSSVKLPGGSYQASQILAGLHLL